MKLDTSKSPPLHLAQSASPARKMTFQTTHHANLGDFFFRAGSCFSP
nr:MAG TPA: hypothetical protein [Caudoviricetes sp.]